jgi:Leucine-rich repeat (LRR) protein
MKLFFVLTIIPLSIQFELICEFKLEASKTDENSKIYACNVVDTKANDSGVKVSSVLGDHIEGQSNENVSAVIILSPNLVTHPPAGLREFFPNIQVYKINQNLKSIERNDFAGLENLKEVDLSANGLESLLETTFDDLIHLEYLNLGANSIPELSDDIFRNLIELKELHLNRNILESISSKLLAENKKLEVINFADNILIYIEPDTFSHLQNVKLLDLSGTYCIPSDYGEFTVNDELEEMLREKCSNTCKETTIELAKLVRELSECEEEVEKLEWEKTKQQNRQKACLLL